IRNPVLINKGMTASAAPGKPPGAARSVPQSELAKVDNESDAEHGKPDPRSPAAEEKKDNGKDKDSEKDDKKGKDNRDSAKDEASGDSGGVKESGDKDSSAKESPKGESSDSKPGSKDDSPSKGQSPES